MPGAKLKQLATIKLFQRESDGTMEVMVDMQNGMKDAEGFVTADAALHRAAQIVIADLRRRR